MNQELVIKPNVWQCFKTDSRGEGQMDLIIRVITVIVIAAIVIGGLMVITKNAMDKAAQKTDAFFDSAYLEGYAKNTEDLGFDFDESDIA